MFLKMFDFVLSSWCRCFGAKLNVRFTAAKSNVISYPLFSSMRRFLIDDDIQVKFSVVRVHSRSLEVVSDHVNHMET